MQKSIKQRSVVAVVALGLAAVAGFIVPAAPAVAVPGLVNVHEGTPFDGQPVKMVVASCPRGTTVIDGGGIIAGSSQGEVRLTGLRQTGTGFEASAAATRGYRGAWRLNAYALCAPRTHNLTYHTVSTMLSDQWWRSARVDCPAGQKLIGLGAAATDLFGAPPSGVALHMLFPSADLSFADASAYQVDEGAISPWRLTVYATCADPLPGLVREVALGPSGDPHSASAICPPGTQVHGVGGGNNAAPGELALLQLAPVDVAGVHVQGQEVGGGAQSTWRAVGVSICAS